MFAAEVIPTSTTLEDLEIHVINPLSEFYEDLLKLTALTNLTRFAIHALDWEGPRVTKPSYSIELLSMQYIRMYLHFIGSPLCRQFKI